jgi:hypothetical protein
MDDRKLTVKPFKFQVNPLNGGSKLIFIAISDFGFLFELIHYCILHFTLILDCHFINKETTKNNVLCHSFNQLTYSL